MPSPPREDVEDVKFVINYDYPNSSEDYIHRIGRTARSTNKGTAYTFFTPGNVRQARELVRVLEEARQAVNPKLLQLVDAGRGGGGGHSRFRGRSNNNNNNPNLMFQDECERQMRGSSSSYSRDSERSSSSSYRERSSSSRDGGRSSNSYEHKNNSNHHSSSSQYNGSRAPQAPPSSSGPQPLMSQQFSSPQPVMGLMGQAPFQFTPQPPPPPSLLSGRK